MVVLMPPGKVKRRYHRKGECGVLCTILMDFRDYHNNTKRSSSVSLIFLWATQSQPYTIGVCVGVGEAVLIINGRRGALLRIMCGIEMWSDLWVCEIAFLKGANLWRFSSFFLFNRVLFAGHVNGIRDVRGCTIYFLQQWRRAAWVDRARGLD